MSLGFWGAMRLLTRVRLRRLVNLWSSSLTRRRRQPGAQRTGTATKGTVGGLLGVGSAVLIFIALLFAAQGRVTAAFAGPLPHETLGLVAALLMLATACVDGTSRQWSETEWDLVWLATLPVPLSTLLVARVVERAVVNPLGIGMLWPLLTCIAWQAWHAWWAPLVGLVCVLPLLLLASLGQALLDTGLRLVLAPGRLRNVQAATNFLGVAAMYLALLGRPEHAGFLPQWAAALPADVLAVLPPALAVRALGSTLAAGFAAGAWLWLSVGLYLVGGFALLHHMLRFGVASLGARESGRKAPVVPTFRPSRVGWAGPVLRRELQLLGRDRSYLVQTCVLPVAVLGMQIYLNMSGQGMAAMFADPRSLASVAFGAGAYALMFSSFQTLGQEGHALWILYTVPVRLEVVLWQKMMLWTGFAMVMPVGLLAYSVARGGGDVLTTVGLVALVGVGVLIYSVMGTALGVLGADPQAQEAQRRVHPGYANLYLMAVGVFVYAIQTDSAWRRLTLVVLVAGLAAALWQKAQGRLAYLLDPVALPPPHVSLADGLVATTLFLVVQDLLVFWRVSAHDVPSYALLFGFVGAGAIVWLVFRLVFWRAGTAGVPRLVGRAWRDAVWVGLGMGTAAAAAGLAYLAVMLRVPAWSEAMHGALLSTRSLTLAALAVIAAPVFEEFIFRGLVFGGLRRLVRPGYAALASAALFALMHPPLSALPVFVLGVAAAFAYERAGMLLAPMLTHAVYNAVVLASQWPGS